MFVVPMTWGIQGKMTASLAPLPGTTSQTPDFHRLETCAAGRTYNRRASCDVKIHMMPAFFEVSLHYAPQMRERGGRTPKEGKSAGEGRNLQGHVNQGTLPQQSAVFIIS